MVTHEIKCFQGQTNFFDVAIARGTGVKTNAAASKFRFAVTLDKKRVHACQLILSNRKIFFQQKSKKLPQYSINLRAVKMWIIFTLLIVIGFLIHKWMTQHFGYFKARGIPHGKPAFLFGTGKDLLMGKISLPEYILKWYNMFPNEK